MNSRLLALVKSDLDTVLCLLQVRNLLLDIIALSGDLRRALELGNLLEDIDTVHVRDDLTHLNTQNSYQLEVMLGRPTYLVRDLSGDDYWNFITFLHCDGPAALWGRQLVCRHYRLHCHWLGMGLGLGYRNDKLATKMSLMGPSSTTKNMLLQ